MKVLLIVVVLVAGYVLYRVVVPGAELTVAEPPTPAFPDADSLVTSTCESRVMAAVSGFPEVTASSMSLSADGSFKGYAATLTVTDADGLSREEDWTCRYYRDGTTDVKRLGGV